MSRKRAAEHPHDQHCGQHGLGEPPPWAGRTAHNSPGMSRPEPSGLSSPQGSGTPGAPRASSLCGHACSASWPGQAGACLRRPPRPTRSPRFPRTLLHVPGRGSSPNRQDEALVRAPSQSRGADAKVLGWGHHRHRGWGGRGGRWSSTARLGGRGITEARRAEDEGGAQGSQPGGRRAAEGPWL